MWCVVCVVIYFGMGMDMVAQTPADFETQYAQRIRQEMIAGVYIPIDMEDAFEELNRLSEPKGLASFKNAPEEAIRSRLHFGLGRWILINWGMEDGSRISHFLKLKGVSMPDDMVRIIIVSWHRRLNGKPLLLEEEIAQITRRMAEEKAAREAKTDTIAIERKPHKD